jgi:cellulose synthase/poly-beta-1,6-N-acetylglucosamine synthase-like glycosyltransferase
LYAIALKQIAVTEAPETLKQFMKQRFRWKLWYYAKLLEKIKTLVLIPRFGTLGMIALPNLLLFQILMPIVAPIADLMFFISIADKLE